MTTAVRRRGPIAARAAIVGLFGVAVAALVAQSITLLVAQAGGPLGLNVLGWVVLVGAAAFPVLCLLGACAIGWRRPLGVLALVLLAAVCAAAAVWLDVVAYALTSGAGLLGS